MTAPVDYSPAPRDIYGDLTPQSRVRFRGVRRSEPDGQGLLFPEPVERDPAKVERFCLLCERPLYRSARSLRHFAGDGGAVCLRRWRDRVAYQRAAAAARQQRRARRATS